MQRPAAGHGLERWNVLTVRYALRYLIRRLIRYAKYAAVGAVAAVLGTTLLGTLGSGLAFFAAPGLLGGAGIGLATALAKVCNRFNIIIPTLLCASTLYSVT